MKSKALRITFHCLWASFLVSDAAAIDPDLARFAAFKESQIREVAEALTNQVPSVVLRYLDAVRVDDWETAENLAERINQASGRYTNSVENKALSPMLRTALWPSIGEVIGAYEQFHNWDNALLHRFGEAIIDSLPEHSIYFGGTDPGRFVISALTEPNDSGRRIFVMTQNQLVDRAYLEYLRNCYGQKLYIPTEEDSNECFQDYLRDARRRLREGKLQPGEAVREVNGRIQVSGAVAVMAINGQLAKIIVDKNPDRSFYIEESFRLDWMYPYLSPHGLIFQLHREPRAELSAAEIEENQEYWSKLTTELIGDWLTRETRVKEVCEFADKVYFDKNLKDFEGNKGFAQNRDAQMCFSKLRSALAGMYVWRAEHSKDSFDSGRMRNTADWAFRQAYAMCPYSPEAVHRFARFLVDYNQPDDAFLLVKTSLRLDPDNRQLRELMEWVRSRQ